MTSITHSTDESSPLLHDLLEAQNTFRVTPLPKLQLAALCISRLIDPVAFTQVRNAVICLCSCIH